MSHGKRIFPAVLLLVFVAVMAGPAAAHPPSSIDLRYEPAGRLLVVGFKHLVQDANAHFIKEIKVQVNGKEFAKIELTAQSGKDGGQVSLSLPEVKTGDLVNVKAECNRFGEMKKDLRIP